MSDEFGDGIFDEDDGEIITCWCGAQGTAAELFDRFADKLDFPPAK